MDNLFNKYKDDIKIGFLNFNGPVYFGLLVPKEMVREFKGESASSFWKELNLHNRLRELPGGIAERFDLANYLKSLGEFQVEFGKDNGNYAVLELHSFVFR